VENGHQVIIGTVRQDGMAPIIEHDGIRIHRLESLFQKAPLIYPNPSRKYHPPFQDILLTKKLGRLVENFQPDMIHCHGWITFSYLPLKFGIPIICTLHHYGFICPKQDLFFENESICEQPSTLACYRCCAKNYGFLKSAFMVNLVKISKRYLSKVDRFVAVSNFVKKVYMAHLKLPESRMAVIPNFYEPENGQKFNCEFLPSDFILYVGQLAPHKGVDLLLKAYRFSGVELPLVMLGSKHYAYDYARFDDGRRIIVKENVSRSLVLNAFERCRFVVAPSIWPEPCPTTILEAMSFGKAVIASEAGGIPEIVKHGETGYLLDPRNIRDFARYLKLLSDDLDLPEKMGKSGKVRFLECFTADKVVEDTENLYDKVLERTK
jgi:glycosyltransferase involved in cell wall biosynthesis